MELSDLRKTMKDIKNQVESFVEKNLGDRAQLEQQVRIFAKQVEKTVTEAVWSKKSNSEPVTVRIQTLDHFKGEMPKYESAWASGFDVRAQLDEPVTLKSGERTLIPTGLSFEIPLGYEIQVRARSGLAVKKGLGLVNAPGTIDADYRGEVKVILINWGSEAVEITDQDRIAQMVVCPIVQARLDTVETLTETERGDGGFGSTGVS
jgi:dUTP pyrophosphatase